MHALNDLSGNSQYSQQQTQYQQGSGTHQTFSQQQYPSQAGYSAQPQGYGNRLHQITSISFSINGSLQMIYSNIVMCAVWLWRCRAVSSVSAGPESAVPSIPLHTVSSITEVLLFWTGEHDDCSVQMTNQYVPEAFPTQPSNERVSSPIRFHPWCPLLNAIVYLFIFFSTKGQYGNYQQ